MPNRIPALIVLNTESGRGSALWLLQNHLGGVRKKYDLLHIFENLSAADLPLLREFFREGVHTFIVVGGDGTLNHFVNLIFPTAKSMGVRPRLGVISSGTGCDFSRTLGHSDSTRKEVRRLLEGQPRPVDVAVAQMGENPIYYLNSASLGLGGFTLSRLQAWHRRYLPKALSYMVPGAEAFLTYKGVNLRVTAANEELYSGSSFGVMVYNGRFSGGGMQWAPQARLDDGLLDVVVKKRIPVAQGPRALFHLFTGHIDRDDAILYRQAREVQVELLDADAGATPAPMELDGELHAATSVKFLVEKQAIEVLY